MADHVHMNEEFNNFMHRVTEVGDIVQKLASEDKNLQEIGALEADKYLKDTTVLDNIDEDTVVLKVTTDRTVINKKAFRDTGNQETMSQEAFMEEVERDANMRYKDKLIRKEKMETFKKQAGLAFRRGEYEKALNCYNKAIEQIKDSVTLYNNRCLTYIKLKMYDEAIKDVEWALRIDEDCFRSQLLLAKAHYLNDSEDKFTKVMQDCKDKNGDQLDFIEDFIEKLKVEAVSKN